MLMPSNRPDRWFSCLGTGPCLTCAICRSIASTIWRSRCHNYLALGLAWASEEVAAGEDFHWNLPKWRMWHWNIWDHMRTLEHMDLFPCVGRVAPVRWSMPSPEISYTIHGWVQDPDDDNAGTAPFVPWLMCWPPHYVSSGLMWA